MREAPFIYATLKALPERALKGEIFPSIQLQ